MLVGSCGDDRGSGASQARNYAMTVLCVDYMISILSLTVIHSAQDDPIKIEKSVNPQSGIGSRSDFLIINKTKAKDTIQKCVVRVRT